MSTWVRSRAWAFSKVTSWLSMAWPISLKCTFTASPTSTTFRVAPMCSASSSALERVRWVVPKQGMVTAIMSEAGRSKSFMAMPVMRMARVESRPPDRPMTAVLAPVCSSRFFRPRAAIFRISSHRSARCASSWGTKGEGETSLVREVSPGSREKDAWAPYSLSTVGKVFIRRRSKTSLSTSISLTVSPVEKRRCASRAPFSAIMLWPVKTKSVVDSPSPASA